jgi:hypothetical protein
MKPHRTDGVSLAFALIFLAIVAWWLAAQLFRLVLPAFGWFVAGALILLGVLGLLGALRSGGSPATPAEENRADAPTLAGEPVPADEPTLPEEPVTAPPATGEDNRP